MAECARTIIARPLELLEARGRAMGAAVTEGRTTFRATGSASVAIRMALSWPRAGLALILALAAALEFAGLDREGYANTYYAAGVKSMLSSWHAFFFASYDAGGFVSIDKPPLGLWVQAASAKLFGFSGLSLLVPEALAGVLSVALLYHVVGRACGPVAGLVAALALALTPISVVTDRNNTIDSLLILTLLLAAWTVTVAAERGSLRLLLLCAAVVGLGFNIKMLQAYLVAPAFGLVYLIGAPLPLRRRLLHLCIASVVLLVVSLLWAVIVDLTPIGQRPYVSDSGSNSELSLALGYNGLGRVTQALFSGLSGVHVLGITIDLQVVPAFAPEIGDPSAFRLLSPTLGSQVGWLLPLAMVGLVGAAIERGPHLPLDRRGQALLLWGGWLLSAGAFFSAGRFFHLYYLVMLAPAVAALAGMGLLALWRLTLKRGWRGWLLPVALAMTAALQAHILAGYLDWAIWLIPVAIGGTLITALVIVAWRLRIRVRLAPSLLLHATPRTARVATTVGVLALLAAPTTWSVVSIANGNGGAWLPQAGPATGFGGAGGGPGGFHFATKNGRFIPFPDGGVVLGAGGRGASTIPRGTGAAPFVLSGASFRFGGGRRGFGGGGGGAVTFAGSQASSLDPKLVRYLRANQGSARYLVATATSSYASLFILAADRPAMALGGYQGWDRIITPVALAHLVNERTVRFFYLPPVSTTRTQPARVFAGSQVGVGMASIPGTNDDLTRWVQSTCSRVPTLRWQTVASSSGGFGAEADLQLYDCAARGHQ